MAKFIATRMYLKPILPETLADKDLGKTLTRVKRALLKNVREQLTQTAFSDRAKKALARSIKIEVKPSSVQITSPHPAFESLVAGRKNQQMKWLTKASHPIPIVKEDGEVIFRNATARSMADGKWVHPGREPSDFLVKAKDSAREFLKERLGQEARKKISNRWKQKT